MFGNDKPSVSASRRSKRVSIDRLVLMSGVMMGWVYLAPLLLLAMLGGVGWVVSTLALGGTAFVIGTSVWFGLIYGRESTSRQQEAISWASATLASAALWAILLVPADTGRLPGEWLLTLGLTMVAGLLTVVTWQFAAFAARYLLSKRSPTR